VSFTLLGILNSQAAAAGGAGAYDLLETTVLASSASSVTFTGLGSYSDYTHLQIRYVTQATSTSDIFLRMNADTGSNYAYHWLQGTGSTVSSVGASSQNHIRVFGADANPGGDVFAPGVIDILDFSSSSKNTTTRTLAGRNATANRIFLLSGLYNDTSAVTSISLTEGSTGNFVTGSRFSLYGIKAA